MAKNNSVLWSLQVDADQPLSYVMGTMHAKSDEAYTHIAVAQKYMSGCQVFAGEIDLSGDIDPGKGFMLDEGVTLETLLGTKKFAKYSRIVKKTFDFDLQTLNHFKPLIAQNLVLEKMINESQVLALDFKLKEIAEEMGLRLTGIETMKEQINIMLSIPLKDQLKIFKDSFKNVSKMKKQLEKTVKIYERGDINRLYKESKKQLGKMKKLMLYKRNRIMADRIADLLKKDACFIAIGAAHLGGSKGVLKLLKDKGIKVFPVIG